MRNDRKGIGGLMESMSALMIVIITLTVFMGMLAYIQTGSTIVDGDDVGFVEKLEIRDGEIVGDIHDDIIHLTESNGYSMTVVNVKVMGDISERSFSDSFGTERTDNVKVHSGTFDIRSDDGRSLLARYEVVIWY